MTKPNTPVVAPDACCRGDAFDCEEPATGWLFFSDGIRVGEGATCEPCFVTLVERHPEQDNTWLYGPLEPHPDQPGVKVVPPYEWADLVLHTKQLFARWGLVRGARVELARRALATAKLALEAGDTNSACDRAAQAAEEMVAVGLLYKGVRPVGVTAKGMREQYENAFPYLADTEETSVALLRTVQQARRSANLLGKVMPKGQAEETVNQAESFVSALKHGISAELRYTEHKRVEGNRIEAKLKAGLAPAAEGMGPG